MKAIIDIRKGKPADMNNLSYLLQSCLSDNKRIKLDAHLSHQIMLSHWYGGNKLTYLAFIGSHLVGSYLIEENLPNLDSHIAHASFIIHPEYDGLGIGKAMAEHALDEAYALGFLAIEFKLIGSISNKIQSEYVRIDDGQNHQIPANFKLI